MRKLIYTLFVIQTLLLCTAYTVRYIVSIDLYGWDVIPSIIAIRNKGWHKVLNILCLLAIWTHFWDRLYNMWRYFVTRDYYKTGGGVIIYIFLLCYYLELINIPIYYYSDFVFPFIAAATFFFPFLFKERLIKNPIGFKRDQYSFLLHGHEGEMLPINKPLSGIFISGIQGSGKTKSIVEPVLAQMLKKGYAGILYDYDFSPQPSKDYSLTHLAHRCLQLYDDKKAIKRKFISINFQDLSTSYRFNPIDPSFISDRKRLSQYLEVFLLNLNPEEAQKRDFWYKNTYILLKSIVIFLSNQYPNYCTLPHAFLLGMQSYTKLIETIKRDEEARWYIKAAEDASIGSKEQFTAVITSFNILLQHLFDKHLFWVLSANEVPVIVNDKQNPLVICLGNTPTENNFTSPILVLIAAVLLGNMYAHDRNKSFLMVDELPMFRLPNLSEIPATARKYGISTVVALQDMSQLEEKYTWMKAKVIQNIFGNYFLGRSSLDGGEFVSKLLGKEEVETTSETTSEHNKSTTTHKRDKVLMNPQEVMSLKEGEFVGKVVHSSGGFFRMKMHTVTNYDYNLDYTTFSNLPVVQREIDVEGNFNRIKKDVEKIINR